MLMRRRKTLEVAELMMRKTLEVAVLKMTVEMSVHLHDLYFHLAPENWYHTRDHSHLAAEH